MQVSVLNGIYTDMAGDLRTSYPRNMIPVPKDNGVSAGYIRPAEGIIEFGNSDGIDRGGINWNGQCYRVKGDSFVRVSPSGGIELIATVANDYKPVSMDYSFDKLAIASAGLLYYYDGVEFQQVIDADLGLAKDVVWVDGYFMTTDGQYLVVTDLLDPTSVNPLKYGSSEADPDPVVALQKLRNEVYALNRYTVEVFNNVGSDLFPFQRVEGAQMVRGCIGKDACAVFMESIAFVGGGKNEQLAVWVGVNGSVEKISSREIEQILNALEGEDQHKIVVESRSLNAHQFLYVHLPDRTLVFDGAASKEIGKMMWFELDSSLVGHSTYRARHHVYCYDKWIVGDPTSTKIGYLTDVSGEHYGQKIGWDFGLQIMYNEGKGAVLHDVELVCLTGRSAFGENPTVWTSYSLDGMSWSQERPRVAGMFGQTQKRITWLQQGFMRHWRVQKFRGTSDCRLSVIRCEITAEPMNV